MHTYTPVTLLAYFESRLHVNGQLSAQARMILSSRRKTPRLYDTVGIFVTAGLVLVYEYRPAVRTAFTGLINGSQAVGKGLAFPRTPPRTVRLTRQLKRYVFCSLFSKSHFWFPACGQTVVTGVVPSPRYVPSFLSRRGFSIPHARHRFATPLFRAFRESIFAQEKVPASTSMRSVKLEPAKVTLVVTWYQVNPLDNRGRRQSCYSSGDLPIVRVGYCLLPV